MLTRPGGLGRQVLPEQNAVLAHLSGPSQEVGQAPVPEHLAANRRVVSFSQLPARQTVSDP
jgi:hypothetical protein